MLLFATRAGTSNAFRGMRSRYRARSSDSGDFLDIRQIQSLAVDSASMD